MTRPRRRDGVSYLGVIRYYVTISTLARRAVFCDDSSVATTLPQVRRVATEEKFAILAYCLMPDQVHLLVEGITDASDFRRFVRRAKQQSGAAYALRYKRPLWQEGYDDRVLRNDTDAREVARYLLWHPVRAGIVPTPAEYPYLGSDVWPIQELIGF